MRYYIQITEDNAAQIAERIYWNLSEIKLIIGSYVGWVGEPGTVPYFITKRPVRPSRVIVMEQLSAYYD